MHIFAVSPQKHEIDFLPANKRKPFLHTDSLTLGVHIKACTKNSKQEFTISLQYLKENVKDDVDFFLVIIAKGFLR